MIKTYKRFIHNIYAFIGSIMFFVITLVLFTLHALWIALSSNLLPYDEYYHMGIIRYYADQWSPFISSQPAEMSLYGDITRLPSYIFHYLMSFPYRIFSTFIENEAVVIVLLRFINIAMVIGAIVLFRRLFIKAGISRRVVNFATAVFLFMPIMPLLAAQNNYDNFMLLLTPIFLTYAYKLVKEPLSVVNILRFGIVGMFITLVKHNFIAVLLVVGLFVLYKIISRYKAGIGRQLQKEYRYTNKKVLILVVALFLVITGLFIERHGVNAIRYQQIKVDCAKVQPVEVCQQFSPWRRNQSAIQKNFIAEQRYGNPASFSIHWVSNIMRGFNAIFANIVPEDLDRPDPFGHYVFKRLMPLMRPATYAIVFAGLLAIALRFKHLWKNELFQICIIGFTALVVALWIFNYTFYLKHGRAYAVQARYLLPMLLPFCIIAVTALRSVVTNRLLKQSIAVFVLTVFLYSGGAVGWIIRADTNWHFPNENIVKINQTMQRLLKNIILY